jgi:hypothetical protein
LTLYVEANGTNRREGMRNRIFGHMRSNVIGYLALFVALGGGAYAAAKIDAGDIERNAVRSKHIKKARSSRPTSRTTH